MTASASIHMNFCRRPQSSPWRLCPECGSPGPLIAAVTEREAVQQILRHLGEPALPPLISPAGSPPEEPAFDWDQTSGDESAGGEPAFEPPPEFELDQTVSG